MKKNIIAVISVCLAISAFAVGCGQGNASESAKTDSSSGSVVVSDGGENKIVIYLDVTEITIGQYGSAEIRCAVSGSGETPVWTTADEEIVALEKTENGCLVNALSVGTTTVEVSVAGVSRSVSVEVTETEYYPVLILSQYEAVPKIGGRITIGAVLMLDDVVIGATLSFVSENEEIAVVSRDGVITGIAAGETYVSVTAQYNDQTIVGKVIVRVVA